MDIKKKLLIGSGISIVLVILSLIQLLIPRVEIKLNGSKVVTLEVGEKYVEKGAQAYKKDFLRKKEIKVNAFNNIDSEKVGVYEVTYEAKNNDIIKTVTRKVIVRDSISPEIKVNGQIKMCKSNNLLNMNVIATDNYDGDLTNSIKYQIDNDKIDITVTDSSSNTTSITEDLHFIDDEKPSITLKGNANITLNKGDTYEEYGATASDTCDGNLNSKIKISGSVDTNTIGEYEITYSVTDSAKKTSTVKRVINVSEKKEYDGERVIYLTFDDGPGQYTEELLSILDKYNVKATFFVTNQFPKYQYLIKKEYENGHTVGIHTYSHKWNIYSSVDSYLEDFNKIESIVYEQTGTHPTIFRFPGGSSNTVSRNYSKGVMTKLASIMSEKGYTYFDWTFDSGDTSKSNNSKEAIIKTVKSHLTKPNSYIILMHDIKKNTIKALPEIIEFAKSEGYTFKVLTKDTPSVHFKIAN